jgi:hypothetical protein
MVFLLQQPAAAAFDLSRRGVASVGRRRTATLCAVETCDYETTFCFDAPSALSGAHTLPAKTRRFKNIIWAQISGSVLSRDWSVGYDDAAIRDIEAFVLYGSDQLSPRREAAGGFLSSASGHDRPGMASAPLSCYIGAAVTLLELTAGGPADVPGPERCGIRSRAALCFRWPNTRASHSPTVRYGSRRLRSARLAQEAEGASGRIDARRGRLQKTC